jgi:hypothetical protein
VARLACTGTGGGVDGLFAAGATDGRGGIADARGGIDDGRGGADGFFAAGAADGRGGIEARGTPAICFVTASRGIGAALGTVTCVSAPRAGVVGRLLLTLRGGTDGAGGR